MKKSLFILLFTFYTNDIEERLIQRVKQKARGEVDISVELYIKNLESALSHLVSKAS